MPFVTKKLFSPTLQRAVIFLVHELGIAQSEAQRLVSKGRLSQNGVIMNSQSARIQGECDLIVFEPETLGLEPSFVTSDFAIYDKPSGLLVHPLNRYTKYSLNDELKHRFGRNANIAHRIDQETSGLVLVARHKKSESILKMLFEERNIKKRYLAMVHGHFNSVMEVNASLLRREDPDPLIRMVVRVHPEGKPSKTFFRPLRYFPEHNMTLVEASPFTGRTHQIRVHLFHVKHPIVGDPIYGQSEEGQMRFLNRLLTPQERLETSGATRLLLHAHALKFTYLHHHYHIVSQKDFIQECFEAMKEPAETE